VHRRKLPLALVELRERAQRRDGRGELAPRRLERLLGLLEVLADRLVEPAELDEASESSGGVRREGDALSLRLDGAWPVALARVDVDEAGERLLILRVTLEHLTKGDLGARQVEVVGRVELAEALVDVALLAGRGHDARESNEALLRTGPLLCLRAQIGVGVERGHMVGGLRQRACEGSPRSLALSQSGE
jgi:hypothetical protein